jgi:monoamine oxidase
VALINMHDLRHSAGSHAGLSIDVAIIGAGVSGLYSGFRLLTGEFQAGKRAPESVHLFEMSGRVGGRLESIRLPKSGVIGELGGMRYLTSHEIVNALVDDVLKIPKKTFPLGNPMHRLAYLRGQRFRADAWEQAQAAGEKFATRYELADEFAGLSPDQLLNKIVFDVLCNDAWVVENYGKCLARSGQYDFQFRIDRRQWNDIKPRLRYCFAGSPYDGMLVNSMGFWNLIKDRVGNEGYEFIAAGGGYFSNTINWNAAEAFPYMIGDFTGSNTEFMTLADGYDQLAMALADKVLSDNRAELWTGNRLCTFSRSVGSSRRYRLTFFNEERQQEWHSYADNVILAMPRRSLELLDQHNFYFDNDTKKNLQRNLDSVIREPSFKLRMGFERPWWHEMIGAHSGESITDLPMRQCYYFGVDPKNHHSLFLASYNDMRTVPFWNVLASCSDDVQRFHASPTRLASQEDIDPWRDDQAPQVLIDEALGQVCELHGCDASAIPAPYITYFKDWSIDPYGGGYHAWRAGVDVAGTMRYMRRPDKNESVHICGEAYSDQQGWVEGAFCVAENMLQEWFGLSWPGKWLRKDYYTGW